jgi:hypothetical protein
VPNIRCRPGLEPGPITPGLSVGVGGGRSSRQLLPGVMGPGRRSLRSLARDDGGAFCARRTCSQTWCRRPRSRGAFCPSLAHVSPSFGREGAGKAGRRLAPAVRAQGNAHGWTTGQPRSPGLPCAMVYGLLRDLPGETSSVATVAARILRRLTPVGVNASTGLTPASGARTTRLRRPRMPSPAPRWLACAHRRDLREDAVSAVSFCAADVSRASAQSFARPAIAFRADAVASTAPRPACRDDRETPLLSDRVVRCLR